MTEEEKKEKFNKLSLEILEMMKETEPLEEKKHVLTKQEKDKNLDRLLELYYPDK